VAGVKYAPGNTRIEEVVYVDSPEIRLSYEKRLEEAKKAFDVELKASRVFKEAHKTCAGDIEALRERVNQANALRGQAEELRAKDQRDALARQSSASAEVERLTLMSVKLKDELLVERKRHAEALRQLSSISPESIVVEKIVHVPVDRVVEKFIEVPVHVPVEVEKIVEVPTIVEKVVEKLVHAPQALHAKLEPKVEIKMIEKLNLKLAGAIAAGSGLIGAVIGLLF
jgi:hypothetical protein